MITLDFFKVFIFKISNLKPKKIVIAGGPGTGKTSLINELRTKGFLCYDEISRQVTIQAQKEGVDQLFLKEPLEFSKRLLNGRIKQFNNADKEIQTAVFLDRGIPDVLAYMDYIDEKYPHYFVDACQSYVYDSVFVLAPWQDIFVSDNERYENFEQANKIHQYLLNTYKAYNYDLINVPFDSINNRANFVLEALNLL